MEGQERISRGALRSPCLKDEYYLNIAKEVARRSTCLKRKYGAVIVNNDEIISTGYNGSPRGCKNCSDTGECLRMKLNIPSKQRYELCKSVHAEMNAIISASRKDTIGGTLYLVGIGLDDKYNCATCCDMCKKMIINAGIERTVCLQFGVQVEYSIEDFRYDIDHMNDSKIGDDIVDDDKDGSYGDEKTLCEKYNLDICSLKNKYDLIVFRCKDCAEKLNDYNPYVYDDGTVIPLDKIKVIVVDSYDKCEKYIDNMESSPQKYAPIQLFTLKKDDNYNEAAKLAREISNLPEREV